MMFAKFKDLLLVFLMGQDLCQMTLKAMKINTHVQIKISRDEHCYNVRCMRLLAGQICQT